MISIFYLSSFIFHLKETEPDFLKKGAGFLEKSGGYL